MFTTELEAAQAYDRESVARKGVDAITNFDLSHYTKLLSSEDLEEAKRRGVLAAPELMATEESAELGAWQELPEDELSDILQGMLTPHTRSLHRHQWWWAGTFSAPCCVPPSMLCTWTRLFPRSTRHELSLFTTRTLQAGGRPVRSSDSLNASHRWFSGALVHEGIPGPASMAQQGLSIIENWADPPLRGYNSMPAMQMVHEDFQLDGFAAAVSQVLLKATSHWACPCYGLQR